jgi:pyruvate/2-oxoglutarate dehydrogenase complex dihydrolipoamide dehydrogenase (E3) component
LTWHSGGYVGRELAQAMRRFSARVTAIEAGPQLAGREDPDVGTALLHLFQDEGIKVLLEAEIREVEGRFIDYCVAKMPMANVLRTWTVSESRGFMKMLIRKNSAEIPGFAAFGFEASELMAAVQTAMIGRMPYTMLRDAIFTHPTVSEGLIALLGQVVRASGDDITIKV